MVKHAKFVILIVKHVRILFPVIHVNNQAIDNYLIITACVNKDIIKLIHFNVEYAIKHVYHALVEVLMNVVYVNHLLYVY